MHSAANNLAAEKFAAEKTGKREGMSRARRPLCLRRRAAGDKIIVTYAVRRRILSERTDMKNEVLEELFKKYYNEAKLYVASLCRDYALADEIVSSSFYKAFTKLDEAGNNFKFWLFKVCRNTYFDMLRRRGRLTALSESMASEEDGDLADRLIKQEEYAALYRAISLLKENLREVIELYYFGEMSVAEIAGITEESTANVKVMLYRGRMKLKQILEGRI